MPQPIILVTKQFNIYIPEMYGSETWGDGYHQESMVFEKGTWKVCDWRYGGEWEDDSYEEYELDVIFETDSVRRTKSFLINNNHKEKIKDLEILLDMYKKFEKCFGGKNKKCKKIKKENTQKQKMQ